MTIENATSIAEIWLNQQTWGSQVKIAGVQLEEDLALVFYDLRSGELMAGNAPLLIDARTGKVHVTGTAATMQYYITNFRVAGDPKVEPIELAKITGWRVGAKRSQR